MEYSMRDLDRLQEEDPDERGRRLSMWVGLASTLITVFVAGFLVWNRATNSQGEEVDPLDRLGASQSSKQRGGETQAKPSVDPTKLTFERALSGEEDRPEVLAALEAAAREEAEIAAAQEARQGADSDDGDAPLAADEADGERGDQALRDIPANLPPPSAGARIPAGLTASSAGSKLEQAAQHDALVAAALPKAHATQARTGTSAEGDFILQVMSYDSKREADAFASALRDRGHDAFVTAGHVHGRRTYRVRVGPFKSRATADAYRREFEQRERMNTLVVRKDEE